MASVIYNEILLKNNKMNFTMLSALLVTHSGHQNVLCKVSLKVLEHHTGGRLAYYINSFLMKFKNCLAT